MTPPWTESADAASLSIVFDGVDVEKREARETEAFKRALSTPVQEEEVRVLEPSTFVVRGVSSWDGLRLGLLVLGGLIGAGALKVADYVADASGAHPPMYALALLFLVCLLAPAGVVVFRHRPRKAVPVPMVALDRFTLELSPSGFSVTGGALPTRRLELGDIERFEGTHGISVVMKGGTREEFPCALLLRVDQLALAERLNDGLKTVRTAAGGYRGALPEGRVRIGPDEEDAPAGADVEGPSEGKLRR